MSEKYPAEHERFIAASMASTIYVSTVVLFELEYGVAKSKFTAASGLRLERFLMETVEILEFSRDDALFAGRVRAMLESRKQPIGHYDKLIAGQALARGLVLVSANQREFERVDGLLWENWSL